MATTIYADTTPLLEAIAAADTGRVIQETLDLLRAQNVLPAKIAGRVGLAALWGNADPHALGVLASVGRVSQWMRTVPAGPEPGDTTEEAAAETPTCDEQAEDATEEATEAATDEQAAADETCEEVAPPERDPALDDQKNGHGKWVSTVATSDAIGGKNCNHGGAVSEAAKKDHEADKAARDAAKAERKAAREAAKAAREAAREHGKGKPGDD